MKIKLSFFLVIAFAINFSCQSIITFADGNLWSKLVFSTPSTRVAKNSLGQWIKVDTNNDLQIQVSEAQQVVSLYLRASEITSMQGIEYFSNLKYLDVSSNNLSMLNLNSNLALETLYCDNNKLTNLSINLNDKLDYLSATWNYLPNITLPINPKQVDLSNNKLTSINTAGNTGLKSLILENNPLVNISLSDNINLEDLNFSSTNIANIDLNNNIILKKLTASSNLITLDLRKNTKLTTLYISGNKLINVDIRNGNNKNMLTVRFGDVFSSPNLRCIYVDWKESHILNNFWIKPYTATYVENDQECSQLNTSEISKSNFTIYPNPVKEKLYFSSEINYTNYEIFNSEGRLIKSSNTLEKYFDVSNFIKVSYFLKLYNNTDSITKQFIKQ